MRLPTDDRRLLPGVALLLAIALGSACSEPCPRVAIAGIISPLPQPLPPPGISLQELPPLGIAGVGADGPHGGTLMAIDERRFLGERGEVLPAWRPFPASASASGSADEATSVTQHLRQLTALLEALALAESDGALRPGRSLGLAATLATLAHSLDAVLRCLVLSGDATSIVNARDARLLQEQAQARRGVGPVRAGSAPAMGPGLLVFDAARESP